MRRTWCLGGSLMLLLLVCLPALAEEPVKLEDVVVSERKLVKPTKQTNETVYTGSEITREGIEAQGAKASVSVYEAIGVLPGVSVESIDPYGLAAEQKNIRIRGVRGISGGHDRGRCPQLRRQPHGAPGIPV